MELELVKVDEFSSNVLAVYSFYDEDSQTTFLDDFIRENLENYRSEVNDILIRLETMKNVEVGAREHYFKHNEGNIGDGICALYDSPNSHLRLYCIRYGTQIIIYGNGGVKPKDKRAFQEVPKLKEENYLLRKLAKEIEKRRQTQEIKFDFDNNTIEGDLNFNI